MVDIYEKFWLGKRTVELPDSDKKLRERTIVDVFETSVNRYGSLKAISYGDQTLTYEQLGHKSGLFAAFLQNNTSLQKGDRVAVALPNLLQNPIVSLGVLRAGMVLTNINPLYSAREMISQIQDSDAKMLITLHTLMDRVDGIIEETNIDDVVITGPDDLCDDSMKESSSVDDSGRVVSFLKAMELGRSSPLTPVSIGPEDLALLQYTGGTTGISKGARLTHRNIVTNLIQTYESYPMEKMGECSEILIVPLPLYHIYAFTCSLLLMIYAGNHCVFISDPQNTAEFIKELKKWRFTGFTGINTLFINLCAHEEFAQVDFSSLKFTAAGGMAVTEAAAAKWFEVTGCPVAEGYGLTETAPVLSFNHQDDIRPGTIGRPVPWTEIKIVDEDGRDLPLGDDRITGEICARGPQVMSGYWRRPEADETAFTQDGFFRTGDIGSIDEEGFIRICGRQKDMILVSGFNVYPNEVEAVLTLHPDIVECAVYGVPHPKSGEMVKATLVSSRPNLTEEEVRNFCKEQLAGYKVPRVVEFRSGLPKSTVGKILHRKLRDEHTEI